MGVLRIATTDMQDTRPIWNDYLSYLVSILADNARFIYKHTAGAEDAVRICFTFTI